MHDRDSYLTIYTIRTCYLANCAIANRCLAISKAEVPILQIAR